MSRGLGRIERGVIKALESTPDRLDVFELARRVYVVREGSPAQVVSVRRALASLAGKGLIADPGRMWRDGRKRWQRRSG
jgi:hypothetical protein